VETDSRCKKDNMGKKKLVNEFCWISYILFYGMYLTKYQNLRIGFQTYLKNIQKKNEKIIKIYVLDIPKYSFIILYSDN
jgi:hypothetical protein